MKNADIDEMRVDWEEFATWWTTYSTMSWDEYHVLIYGA